MQLADAYWRDGYAVVRRLFDPAEVAAWRARALAPAARIDDLLCDPVLRDIVLDPRLIALARDVLGGQPVYFGNSNVSIGGDETGLAGFHKDNSDRYDAAAPDWSTDRYPVMQFGLYMQPHGRLPGGLDLRRGSHLHPDITTGEHVSPAVEPGDLLIWTGRTTHSSHSKIVRGLGWRMEPNGLAWRVFARFPAARIVFARHPERRVVAIGAYGLAGHPLLDRHIEYLRHRADRVEAWQRADYGADAAAIAASRGLALLTPAELLEGAPERTHDHYVQLPY